MERKLIKMDDPVFLPSQTKTATVTVTITPSAIACGAELFIGPNATTKIATSGVKAFTSTGSPQDVSCPVVMPAPSVGTAYHVYIDITVGGVLLLAYQGTEDVVIPAGSVGGITWA